jgi:hypothetical protein
VTFVAEDSLPWDPSLNGKPHKGPGNGTISGNHLFDSEEVGNRGLRQYPFVLLPKETIKFGLQGVPPGKMAFLLAFPLLLAQDPLFTQIRRVNRMPYQSRQSRLEFENTQPEPYTIVLLLLGRVELPYRINIDRTGGVHPASTTAPAN